MGKRYEVVDDLQDWRRDMIEAHHIIINLKKPMGNLMISTTFFFHFLLIGAEFKSIHFGMPRRH